MLDKSVQNAHEQNTCRKWLSISSCKRKHGLFGMYNSITYLHMQNQQAVFDVQNVQMFLQGLQVSTHVFHGQSVSLWLRLRSTRIEKFNKSRHGRLTVFVSWLCRGIQQPCWRGETPGFGVGGEQPHTLVTTGKKYLPWLISFNQCIHSKQQRPLLALPHRKRRYPITFIA